MIYTPIITFFIIAMAVSVGCSMTHDFEPQFEEHDLVRLNSNYDEIPSGSEGTIVYSYTDTLFEVEFYLNGSTITRTVDSTLLDLV